MSRTLVEVKTSSSGALPAAWHVTGRGELVIREGASRSIHCPGTNLAAPPDKGSIMSKSLSVPSFSGRALVRLSLFAAAGVLAAGCTVALRQYPCGDDLTTTMLADLNRWIMEVVCPSQA